MSIRWTLILLFMWLICAVMSMSLDAAQLADQQEMSVFNKLMNGNYQTTYDTTTNPVAQISAGVNTFSGLWDLVTWNYSFFDSTNWMIVAIRWFFVMFGWVIITIFFLSFARGGGSTL